MKLKLLICVLFSITQLANAQTKTENLLSEKSGKINVKYIKSTNLEKNEVNYLLYLGFQNENYQTITDIKSLGFNNPLFIDAFLKDLIAVKTQMDLKEKVNLSWNRKYYNLKLYDFTPALYLSQSDGVKAYCTIDVKEVDKLIKLISKIDFGKDVLLEEVKK